MEGLRGLLGGAAYGFTVVAISHPLDTVKTRQQAIASHGRLGMGGALLRTVSAEGPLALYKGFWPAFAGSVMFRSVPFLAYTSSTTFLRARSEWLDASPVALAALGGAAGGLSRSVLETPFELAKTRRQVNLDWAWSVRSLSRGMAITTLRNVSVISLFWVFVELSKDTREAMTSNRTIQSFLAGGGCSVAAWAVVFPLDTLKARIQASSDASAKGTSGKGAAGAAGAAGAVGAVGGAGGAGATGAAGVAGRAGSIAEGAVSRGVSTPTSAVSAATSPPVRGVAEILHHAKSVYHTSNMGGIGGFYRGFGAGLARPLVANGLGFVVYDKIMAYMKGAGDG